MRRTTITDRKDERLAFISQLYLSTFPENERRDWNALLRLLPEPKMHLQLIEEQQTAIGYILWWQLKNWLYIEHLAISPEQRGKHYGQRVMKEMIEEAGGDIVLETELPVTDDAKRRIDFYNSLGLQTLPFNYSQPPYRKAEPPVPMQLMSIKPIASVQEFNAVATLIRNEVYEPFW